MRKETMKDAGYKYGYFDNYSGGHILIDIETGEMDLFFANKNHASWGIIYKNTHLEFAKSI